MVSISSPQQDGMRPFDKSTKIGLAEGSQTGFSLLQVSLVFVLQFNVGRQNFNSKAISRLPIRARSGDQYRALNDIWCG